MINKHHQYMETLVKELIPQHGEMAINLQLKDIVIDDLTTENQTLKELVQRLEEEVQVLRDEQKTLHQIISQQRGRENYE